MIYFRNSDRNCNKKKLNTFVVIINNYKICIKKNDSRKVYNRSTYEGLEGLPVNIIFLGLVISDPKRYITAQLYELRSY